MVSGEFEIRCGLRQGDVLSCDLFNLVLEMVVRDIVTKMKGTIFDRLVHAYADDVDIIARNLRSLTEDVEMLKVAALDVGLEINATKTKYLKSGRADGLKNLHLRK